MTNDEFGQTWITAFSSDLPPRDANALPDLQRRRSRIRPRDAMARRLTVASLRFGSLSTPAAPTRQARRARVRPRLHSGSTLHVLPQAVFRDVLAREQKRAERYDQVLVLLLVGIDDAGTSPAEIFPGWASVIDALAAASGDTGVLGWFEGQSVLGSIVPVVGGSQPEALVREELARRLAPDVVARLGIRSRVYSPESALEPNDGWSAGIAGDEPASGRAAVTRDAVKRALDVAGSLTLLLLLSPVLLVIAALLKLSSPGPVLFRQPRVGRMARPFTMLKFRTMRVDADHALHQEFVTKFIKASVQIHSAGREAIFKLTSDPRVTPLGRILRKTSLDELPQLWNVLRGEMSLVGPRPPLPYEVDQYRPWHRRRVIDAKPGITGLWQVKGRSRTTFDEMVRLDLQYARTYSLWTDIKILLATPRAVISGKGAA